MELFIDSRANRSQKTRIWASNFQVKISARGQWVALKNLKGPIFKFKILNTVIK